MAKKVVYLTAAVVYLGMMVALFAKPVPAPPSIVPPKQAKPKDLPDLAFDCRFGTIYQNGPTLSILGGTSWTALGHVRSDGKVYLLWTDSDGNAAHGLYNVTDKSELDGFWGYARGCAVGEDGELKGSFSIERLTRPIPVVPEF